MVTPLAAERVFLSSDIGSPLDDLDSRQTLLPNYLPGTFRSHSARTTRFQPEWAIRETIPERWWWGGASDATGADDYEEWRPPGYGHKPSFNLISLFAYHRAWHVHISTIFDQQVLCMSGGARRRVREAVNLVSCYSTPSWCFLLPLTRLPSASLFPRMCELMDFLRARPEETVAVVAHWGVIYSLTGKDVDNCDLVRIRASDLPRTPYRFS